MRYYAFSQYLRGLFGFKVHRVPLDAGLVCPHRFKDLTGGCIYCNRLGSGTGAYVVQNKSVSEQMQKGIEWAKRRFKAKGYIAYFQSYSNTNANLEILKALYDQATAFEGVVGLFVATRPDCLDKEVIELLVSYKDRLLVWLELGLQSMHQKTLQLINRGHDLVCFEKAFNMAKLYGIPVCTHVIMGLPYETKDMMLETVSYLANIHTDGIKFHNLYITKDCPMWAMYERERFPLLSQKEYVEIVVESLELLPKDVVIMRLTGDPPQRDSIPEWAHDKVSTIDMIHKRLEELTTYQGRRHQN